MLAGLSQMAMVELNGRTVGWVFRTHENCKVRKDLPLLSSPIGRKEHCGMQGFNFERLQGNLNPRCRADVIGT